MKTIAFIPIRGGSKSIPHKNIKIMNGKPLFAWAMEAAEGCDYIDEVLIVVDDDITANAVYPYIEDSDKIDMIRVYEMGDTCMQEDVIKELLDDLVFEDIVLMQATQPLTTSEDLTGGCMKYFNSELDSLVSVCRQHRFLWDDRNGFVYPINYNPRFRPRRQEWDGMMVENGAFFITSRKAFEKSLCRVSGNIGVYEMSPETFWDIDEPEDWLIMEQLLIRSKGNG